MYRCILLRLYVYNYNYYYVYLGDELIAELASMRPEKDVVVECKVCLYRYRYRCKYMYMVCIVCSLYLFEYHYNYIALGDEQIAELAAMRPQKDVVVEFKVC